MKAALKYSGYEDAMPSAESMSRSIFRGGWAGFTLAEVTPARSQLGWISPFPASLVSLNERRYRTNTMKQKPIDALKSLSELALAAPGLEPLVVYDSVATLAAKLAEDVNDPEYRDMVSAVEKASTTARAVRDADRREVDFRDFLKLGGGAI